MYYKAELEYIIKVLKKMHVKAVCISREDMHTKYQDFGLRKILGVEERYAEMFRHPEKWIRDNAVYKLTDEFQCRYIFMKLPRQTKVFLVGPYLNFEKDREMLLEEAERYSITPRRFGHLEACYVSMPVITDESFLFMAITAFAETVWGEGAAFEIIDINYETDVASAALPRADDVRDPEEIMMHMKAMEERYAYENELMETVSQGLSHRAEMMLSSFSKSMLDTRSADPVRNVKNYCIICNTLMRKAAEKGGVHPVHLDSASSMLARRVEGIASFKDGKELMRDTVTTYCRLVKKHSANQYAPFVRKTVAYIESDLSGDLSLHTLASLQSINPSYLSTLFHKETGKTITEFVNEKRMELAARLLRTTQLQIQTVAQYCGVSDVNYFSKIFKKLHGMTPKQYREENSRHMVK